MKQKFILLFFTLNMVVLSCSNPQKEGVKVVTAEEIVTLLKNKNMQLIDVRTPEEYNEGYITNAQNINFLAPTFSDAIKNLDKKKPVIVYCKSGRRSGKSIKKLLEAGFKEIYDLEGGFTKWKQDGFDFIVIQE